MQQVVLTRACFLSAIS